MRSYFTKTLSLLLISLDDDAFAEFLTELSEEQQQIVFQGLNRHKEEKLWKNHLENTYSHWHALYMYWIDQYAPDQYLANKLRATISQQWENGLTVIEELLGDNNYRESLAVIEETIQAMAKRHWGTESWTPDSSLLFTHVSHSYPRDEYLRDYKALLRHYQKTAKGLNETPLENALKIQHLSFNHFFNWQRMFKAFDESSLPAPTRQALFRSWRDHIIEGTRPDSWGFGRKETGEAWWLHWLIESIAEPQKGSAYFQKQLSAWLKRLEKSPLSPDEDLDFAFLRLLTKDLNEMGKKPHKDPYPQFYQVVIRPGELSTPDDASRWICWKPSWRSGKDTCKNSCPVPGRSTNPIIPDTRAGWPLCKSGRPGRLNPFSTSGASNTSVGGIFGKPWRKGD